MALIEYFIKMKKSPIIILSLLLFAFTVSTRAQRVMEKLDRGLVAVRTSTSQVFLSWRMLGSDPDNVAFNLYRDGVKINDTPISTVTNYNDNSAVVTTYSVKTVINGIETGESDQASIWSANYLDIPLNIPASMTMPDASTCTYSPADCSTGDVDGDGEYEIVVKWDPSNAKDNSQSGYTGNVIFDVYKLNGLQLCRIDLGKNIRAGAHYTQFMVADFDGDGKAEIACKTAPGTKDGTGNYISKGPAATAVHTSDYRNSGGYILTGPEYFTVFSGLTGAELATANYNPQRGSVSSWGDSYGNRVDRFLAGIAYLDGVLPSIIMCRGYYTRAVIAAWDYRNGTLTNRWTYDSGTSSGVGLYGQGNHNMSVADVDEDGKDEIIWGSGAVDHDGKLMYRTGLGHGDAMHLSDLAPDRKGLEVWTVHESTSAAYGEEMHDAKTGAIIWGTYTGSDNGRGCTGNIIPGNRGFEMWSASGSGVMSKTGANLNSSKPSMNFRIYWDGDLSDELLDGTSITKYSNGTIFSAANCSSNNGTKSTPNLSADIIGDWREEVIFRTNDNTKLRIFTTTSPTSYKMYTLMHDAVYRNSIAWQNTAYNQPPHAGFYIGNDMDATPPSVVYNDEKRWKSGTSWDNNISSIWTDKLNQVSTFNNGDGVMFDISAGANSSVNITGNLLPKSVKVNTTFKVEFSGEGTLDGTMDLIKMGTGSLKLNNNNNYSGVTSVWNSEFYNNGNLSYSEVLMNSYSKLGGNGIFGQNVTLNNFSSINAGNTTGEVAKLTFQKSLKEVGNVVYNFDIKMTDGVVTGNDTLFIGGDWILSGKSSFTLNVINGPIVAGSYKILHCNGSVTGDLTKIKITGIPTYLSYNLQNSGGDIILKIDAPAALIWKGSVDGKWDNGKTSNWVLMNDAKTFTANDSVLFNDEALLKAVIINESVSPASILFENSANYTFSGSGSIEGVGKITKSGSGKLLIANTNKYTGKTIINNGTIEFSSITNGGIASPIGAASNASSNIELNGGKLSYIGPSATIDRGFSLGSNGGTISVGNSTTALTTSGKIIGSGKLIKEGNGRLAITGTNTFAGGTLIKGGSIGLTTDVANSWGLGTDTITMQGGSLIMFDSNTTSNTSTWKLNVPSGFTGSLVTDGNSVLAGSITGGGTLNYYTNYTANTLSADASMFTGTINVTTDTDGGFFALYNTKGLERAKINLNNLVTMMYRITSNITIQVGDLTGFTNSVLGAGGTGTSNITWEIGARNANSTFNGKITNEQISGTGAVTSIRKTGTGTWTLTNNNTYTGGTTINGGTLMVNNTTGSGLGTGVVSVNFDATLSGSGTIAATTYVYEGGVIEPGNGIGTFTVNNNLDMLVGSVLSIDIDKPNSKNDVLNVTGTLNMNGKLLINATSETVFSDGDSFKIISGTINSLPQEILPAVPAPGLEWDMSDFIANGMIKVKNATGLTELQTHTKIYPNPASDYLRISCKDAYSDLNVSIRNAIGTELFVQNFNDRNEMNCDISVLPKGIYFIHLKTETESFTTKFIKK